MGFWQAVNMAKAKAAEEQPPTPAAAEEPRPAAAEALAGACQGECQGAGAAPAKLPATLWGPQQRLGEYFFASVEDSDDDDGDSDDGDGDSDDDDGFKDDSVDMSTWTPEEIAEFNKVCVRGGLGIRYTS